MFYIPELLSAEQVTAIRQKLESAAFVDGRGTAGAGSNYQKNNLQGDPNDAAIREVQEQIHRALTEHPKFKVLAMPRVTRPMTVNRYDEGMFYKDHMDHALLPGETTIRGDLSVTVFLSEPESYDGGELVVEADAAEPTWVKLPAGHAVVYSAATLHRVETVTRGTRLGAVTTIESLIADETDRQLMGEVAQLVRWVQDAAPRTPQERLANKVYVNLMRRWIKPGGG